MSSRAGFQLWLYFNFSPSYVQQCGLLTSSSYSFQFLILGLLHLPLQLFLFLRLTSSKMGSILILLLFPFLRLILPPFFRFIPKRALHSSPVYEKRAAMWALDLAPTGAESSPAGGSLELLSPNLDIGIYLLFEIQILELIHLELLSPIQLLELIETTFGILPNYIFFHTGQKKNANTFPSGMCLFLICFVSSIFHFSASFLTFVFPTNRPHICIEFVLPRSLYFHISKSCCFFIGFHISPKLATYCPQPHSNMLLKIRLSVFYLLFRNIDPEVWWRF